VRRDLAILQLLLHTGIRISEIVDLRTDDVIFDNPGVRLRVGSTGNSEIDVRYLPLPNQVYRALYDYMLVRPQNSDYIFLGQDGRPISSRTVQRVVGSCSKSAGLRGVSAQSLRRTFALNVLAETDDLSLVSELLGHQNKTITEQYLAVHQDSHFKNVDSRN
jgi:integrase